MIIWSNWIPLQLLLPFEQPFCESDRVSTSQSPLYYEPEIPSGKGTMKVGGGFGPQHLEGYGISYFFEANNNIGMCKVYIHVFSCISLFHILAGNHKDALLESLWLEFWTVFLFSSNHMISSPCIYKAG